MGVGEAPVGIERLAVGVDRLTPPPQILSGKVYVPPGFGAAGFEMSTTVNVWSAAM